MIQILLKVSIAIISSLVLLSCSGEKSSEEYIASAKEHIESGDLPAAVIESRNAVKQAPENPDARVLLGGLELQSGNPEGAENEFLKAIELGATKARIAKELSHTYFLQNKFDELRSISVEDLQDANKATVLGYQAESALAQGDFLAANALSAEAVIADPMSAVALTASARVQLVEHNIPVARTILATVLDNDPTHSPGWELLGDIEASEDRFTEAVSAYSNAVGTAADVRSSLFKRARTQLILGDFDAVSADLAIFENAGVKTPVLRLLKSQLLMREGKLADAQLELEEALKVAPDYPPAVRTIAITHLLRGNIGQSEQYAKQYLDDTESDDAYVLLAAIRLQAERYAQAERTLLPLAESGRLDSLGSQVLATTQLKMGNLDKAVNTMMVLHNNFSHAGVPDVDKSSLAMNVDPVTFLSDSLLTEYTADPSKPDETNYLSNFELLVVNAVTALAQKDYEEALAFTETLVELEPENPDTHSLLARIQASIGNLESSKQTIEQALALSPNHLSATILSAMLKINDGNPDTARDMLEDTLAGSTGDDRQRILLALAAVATNTGDEKGSIEWLEQARSEYPSAYQPAIALARKYAIVPDPANVIESLNGLSGPGAQNGLVAELIAQSHIKLEQFDAAIEILTPMVQAEPDSANWRFLRANALAGKNDLDAVNSDLDVALRIDPDHVPSKLAKVNMNILTNDLVQAKLQLAQLESMIPGSDELKKLSRRIEEAAKRQAQTPAAQVFDSPENTQQVMDTARAHWSTGKQELAVSTLSDWLDANPNDVTVGLTLANTYTSMERQSDAVNAFEAVLDVDPDNFVALNNLAWQLRNEKPETAISYAERAVQLQPNNASTLDTLAVIQLEKGMFSEAGKTFETIRSLEPTDPTILFHGAQIQAALGENEDAKSLLKPLIENKVDFPDAAAARALYSKL